MFFTLNPNSTDPYSEKSESINKIQQNLIICKFSYHDSIFSDHSNFFHRIFWILSAAESKKLHKNVRPCKRKAQTIDRIGSRSSNVNKKLSIVSARLAQTCIRADNQPCFPREKLAETANQ